MTHTKRKKRRKARRKAQRAIALPPSFVTPGAFSERVMRAVGAQSLGWDVAYHLLRHVADVFMRRAAEQLVEELEQMRREPRPRLRVIRGGKS